MAAGTPAGATISNTATATFDNPNGGGTVTVTSNTVSITVAEIAGISVTNAGFTDVNGSSVTTDDVLYFDFKVTNTGNDTTGIYLPVPNVVGATATSYDIINPTTGAVIANVPLTGGSTINLAGLSSNGNGILNPDESYTVRVTVSVTATNVNDPVTVTLGDGTDNAEGTPNPEVRTTDAPDGTADEVNGTPTNGEQEGTATNTVTVGSAPRFKAFATVLKTATAPVLNNVLVSTDDVVQYGLQLKVDNNAPAGTTGYTVTDLQPVSSVNFSANKNGSGTLERRNVVIMSDAIPANTRIALPSDPGYRAPVVPTDSSGVVWRTWYAYSNATGNVAANTALEDVWTDQAPSNVAEAGLVKRIAFVKEGVVAKGVTTTSGTFSVVTNGISAGGSIYNIAQVVGQSVPGADQILVYDESGDQNPSNFDGATPNSSSDLTLAQFNTDGANNSGEATPLTGIVTDATPGVDPGNNIGSGPAGEVLVTSIGGPLTAGLLNGPANAPSALGPTDNQDDFTNKSINGVSGDQSSSALATDPEAYTFTNTVASSATINNVVIRPISATEAKAVDSNPANDASFDVSAAVPNGTVVIIRATVPVAASGGNPATTRLDTATYTLTGGVYVLTSSTSGGSNDTTAKPIVFGDFVGGVPVNYEVRVDLPAGTASLQGYSIPVVAYVEGDGVGQPGYGELNVSGNVDQSPNVTINRLYTGFMKVDKEVRVLAADGITELQAFSKNPSYQPKPSDILEYRITYQNISTAPSGSGSVTLSATNFKVLEDGLRSPNNWGSFTDHVLTKAVGKSGTTVSYYNGLFTSLSDPGTSVAESTTITGYVNTIGTVAPSPSVANGNFTFQRTLR